MVWFVGAGPGDPELITVKGQKLLREADTVIYAGSLVNPALLGETKAGCAIYNSATMTLEQVIEIMVAEEKKGRKVVRLHTGDPSIYGAIREQMDALRKRDILFQVCPGVSAFCGAAAALKMEYTLPDVSQSVILTRRAGRTPVREAENLESLAQHGATMVIFLSTSMAEKVSADLIRGGYAPETPAAIVYKATWPEEKTFRCTVETLGRTAKENHLTKTALLIVGAAAGTGAYSKSCLYDANFETEFRKGQKD